MGRPFFASLPGRSDSGLYVCEPADVPSAGIPDREDRAEQQDSRPAVVSVIWRSLILLCARSYPLGYSYLSCPPIMAFHRHFSKRPFFLEKRAPTIREKTAQHL